MGNLIAAINGNVSLTLTVAFFLRVVIACLCGAVVGFERSKRFKEAGIRTHCVVAFAAAVFAIISKYGFADLAMDMAGTQFPGDRGADPARIAAQVVSGLGFLGAGIIFKNGNSIKGLTTAAGIWATAGIGMAIGAGMYLVGVFSTIILVVIQILTHTFTVGNDSYVTSKFVIVAKNSVKIQDWLTSQLGTGVQISGTSMKRNDDDTITYQLTVRTLKNLDFSKLMSMLDSKDNVLSVSIAGE